jgi:lipid A 3-O-deacylase
VKKITCILAALALLGTASAAYAQDDDVSTGSGQDLLSFGVGYWDIGDDEGAADFRLEYRPYAPIIIDEFRPWVGFEVTSDWSIWGGAGFLFDWNFSPNWYLTPSVGVGFYSQGDSDLDLGSAIEFRSQLELAYSFNNGYRVGAAFGHLSNASIDDDNPGTEVLNVYWHMPF